MATGGDSRLTNSQIVQLAATITVNAMKTIAEEYLGIDSETVVNIEYENKNNAQAVNREIIRRWANKPANAGPDQVRVRVSLVRFWK